MSNINGVIAIDFDTPEDVTEEQFKNFEKALKQMVDDKLEMMIYDLAEKCGFEADSVHPVMLNEIYKDD